MASLKVQLIAALLVDEAGPAAIAHAEARIAELVALNDRVGEGVWRRIYAAIAALLARPPGAALN